MLSNSTLVWTLPILRRYIKENLRHVEYSVAHDGVSNKGTTWMENIFVAFCFPCQFHLVLLSREEMMMKSRFLFPVMKSVLIGYNTEMTSAGLGKATSRKCCFNCKITISCNNNCVPCRKYECDLFYLYLANITSVHSA